MLWGYYKAVGSACQWGKETIFVKSRIFFRIYCFFLYKNRMIFHRGDKKIAILSFLRYNNLCIMTLFLHAMHRKESQ